MEPAFSDNFIERWNDLKYQKFNLLGLKIIADSTTDKSSNYEIGVRVLKSLNYNRNL